MALNMQGDIVGIADTNGAMQTEYTYDPWGKVLSATGNETLGNLNPFRYRCYYYDTETALPLDIINFWRWDTCYYFQ